VQVTGGAPVNHAPVALNDSYSVTSGNTLNVVKPGVLANDTDADGNTLKATAFSNPANGTLTPSDDGSFIYTPAAGYTGPDSFTYKATDGTLSSDLATASIKVTDVITIVTSTWARKMKLLTVEAISSAQPNVALTIQNYNASMTYNASRQLFTFTSTISTKPSTVTVTSSLDGSATKAVATK
jgi:large repetitive protein